MIDTQARGELKYEWRATFSDGKVLTQYNDRENTETSFHEVVNLLNELDTFELISRTNPPIKLNLRTGLFWQSNTLLSDFGEDIRDKKIEIGNINGRAKLIYFRRYKRFYGPGVVNGVEISYFLGWEARIDGTHKKYEIEISENGTIKMPVDELEKDGFKQI